MAVKMERERECCMSVCCQLSRISLWSTGTGLPTHTIHILNQRDTVRALVCNSLVLIIYWEDRVWCKLWIDKLNCVYIILVLTHYGTRHCRQAWQWRVKCFSSVNAMDVNILMLCFSTTGLMVFSFSKCKQNFLTFIDGSLSCSVLTAIFQVNLG